MPAPRSVFRPGRRGRDYPYGVGDGTRDTQPTRDTTIEADAGETKQPTEAGDGQAESVSNDRPRYDDAPDYGVQAQEQIINVLPDQTIKLVVGSGDSKAADKKEHPQDRIDKFWANFEPEYLGGVAQILPDTVGQVSVSTPQDSSLSPKAVHSYENARNSCIKSVKRIIRECRSNNQKYTDLHFDLERDLKVTQNRDCLYGLTSWDDTKDPGDVKRITDIYEHPQFYKDGAGFDDIVQGALGDCWFLAGLSAITANQELLRKVCVVQDQDVGVYGFVFHRDGDWHPCIVDDKLYLSAPSFDESGDTVLEQYGVKQKEQEKLYLDTLQKGSKALYFGSCRDENETWVPLFEKAYAKAHGDFTALDGGQVGEALEDLTGGVTTEIYTTNILNKESFWRDLCRIGKDFIFSCHVSVFSNWRGDEDDYVRDRRRKGIVELHAYSVLATYEGYGQKLVKIRNPWGEMEWNGAWSDGSKEWTPEWLYRLEHKFGDDGVFWMSYDDMLKRYKYMDRTRLFGPEWYVAQEWTSVQVPWNCRDYQSTTFSIDVPEDTEAVIALSQLDDRYFRGLEGAYYYTLSFRVQKFGEDEDEDDYFARSPVNYELRRSTNVEVSLEKGKYTVLFKIEASKTSKNDIEKVIRENIWRRDKVTQMATLYDLAYRKGRPPKTEKKEEPPVEQSTVAEPINVEPAPTTQETEPKTAEKPTEDAKPEGAKTEEAKSEEVKKEETIATGDKPEDKVEEAKDSSSDPPAQKESSGNQWLAVNRPPPNVSSTDPTVQDTNVVVNTPDKLTPDEKDPNRNPWNAYCIVGLRVFSKLADLQLKVVKPGDKSDGVTLDRDDIAKAALTAAEKAEEKQQTQPINEEKK